MKESNNTKLHIVMYHYTRDLAHSRYPGIKGLDVRLFRKQMEFFKQNFNFITMQQLIDSVDTGAALPGDAVLLMFDDGYADNYTYALPILEEYGVQGSFFIPGKTFSEHALLDVNKVHYILAGADTGRLLGDLLERMDHYRGREFDFPSNEELFHEYAAANRFDTKEVIFIKRMLQTALPERLRNLISSDLFKKHVGISEEQLAYELYMTEDQIRTLKRHGMFLGIHGYDHYWLADLPEGQMGQDIDRALEAMREFIEPDAWVMNYPYGSSSEQVVGCIREKGCILGLTTEVRAADMEKDDRYRLPRFDCNDFPPKSENYRRG